MPLRLPPPCWKLNQDKRQRSVVAGLMLAAACLAACGVNAQDAAPLPVFKASWTGPQPAGPLPPDANSFRTHLIPAASRFLHPPC